MECNISELFNKIKEITILNSLRFPKLDTDNFWEKIFNILEPLNDIKLNNWNYPPKIKEIKSEKRYIEILLLGIPKYGSLEWYLYNTVHTPLNKKINITNLMFISFNIGMYISKKGSLEEWMNINYYINNYKDIIINIEQFNNIIDSLENI